MISSDGAYRTDDMALATVLSLAGFSYTLVRVTERKAQWIFVPPDDSEDFEDLLDGYRGFDHKIEPRVFIQRYTEIRTELFRLLDQPYRSVASAADGRR